MDHIRGIVASTKELAKGQDIACEKEISDLDQQIAALQQQRRQAVETKRAASLISKLGDARDAWERLPKRLKYSKNNVLAALCGSQNVPDALREANWAMNAPLDLKDDREILIARASNPRAADCETYLSRNATITIPEPLLGDLEVLRAIAKPYPKALLHPDIPSTIFDDDGLLLAFLNRKLKRYHNANVRDFRIALEHVLARFSPRIRSNAQFMIQAASAGFNVFPYIAGGLRSDKGVCLQLARVSEIDVVTKIPDDVLTYLSESLQTDRDITLLFVSYNGYVLKHASLEHQQDLEIVRAASMNKAAALLHGGETAKERLCCDKEFIGKILARKIRCYQPGHFPSLYTMLSDGLKLDLDIIVAAHKGDCLNISDLPNKLTQHRQFWKNVLAKSCLFWKDLPDAFRRDITIARCIRGFQCIDMVMEVVNLHPSLAVEVDFWCNSILGCTSDLPGDEIVDLVNKIGSEVRNNRTVMLRACAKSSDLLPCLSREFQIDREFVEETVRHHYDALLSISHEAQLLYPELTAIAISNDYDEHTDSILYVNPELWSNLAVAEAWFRRGGPIHDSIPFYLEADPTYCLLIVEHCFESARGFVAESLTSSKQFMLRAVGKNPSAYILAPESLKFDFDLILAGFGSPKSDCLVDRMIADGFPLCVHVFLQDVRRKLQSHEGFHALLFGMSTFSGSDCQLRKLRQGQETSRMLKRRIADFLGCPMGGEVVKLRRAAAALGRFPAPVGATMLERSSAPVPAVTLELYSASRPDTEESG